MVAWPIGTLLLLLSSLAITADAAACPPGPQPLRRVRIHPRGQPNKCLAIEDAAVPWKFGVWALIRDCKSTLGYIWEVRDQTSTIVRIEGSEWCLNAGTEYHVNWFFKDGAHAQLVYCGDAIEDAEQGSDASTWYYTRSDGTFKYSKQYSTTRETKCLDIKDGKLNEGSDVQIWECFQGNKNQQWDIEWL